MDHTSIGRHTLPSQSYLERSNVQNTKNIKQSQVRDSYAHATEARINEAKQFLLQIKENKAPGKCHFSGVFIKGDYDKAELKQLIKAEEKALKHIKAQSPEKHKKKGGLKRIKEATSRAMRRDTKEIVSEAPMITRDQETEKIRQHILEHHIAKGKSPEKSFHVSNPQEYREKAKAELLKHGVSKESLQKFDHLADNLYHHTLSKEDRLELHEGIDKLISDNKPTKFDNIAFIPEESQQKVENLLKLAEKLNDGDLSSKDKKKILTQIERIMSETD